MKLNIDLDKQTIELFETVNLQELFDNLKNLNLDLKKYLLIIKREEKNNITFTPKNIIKEPYKNPYDNAPYTKIPTITYTDKSIEDVINSHNPNISNSLQYK